MQKTIIRFIGGRRSARFLLPILLLWLFAHAEAAFGQLPPQATTKETTNITATSGTLNGEVSANSVLLSVTVKFEYGATKSYGNTVTANPSSVTGLNPAAVRAEITGLLPNTTYHYRVVGEYLGLLGELLRSEGADETFKTLALNQPPVVVNPISDQTLTLGGSSFARNLNASPAVFSDPDGDPLTYTANSSSINIATTNLTSNRLIVTPVAVGSATITVTANDNRGGTVSTAFTVTVVAANNPPTVANTIPNQNLTLGGAPFARNLNASPAVFSDPDGDALAYSANSSAANIATASISGSTLTVTPVAVGSATITVTANDDRGGTVSTAFTVTVVAAPTATTNAATSIGSTSATLNGMVNPNNASTIVKFQYGATTSYGSEITATQSPVAGSSAVAVSAMLTGLASNTQFHYRVVATNSAGTANGANQIFNTIAVGSAPTVTTNAATDVCSTSATLRGTVNPNGLNTTIKFEYGATTSYGDTATLSPVTGTNLFSVRVALANLSPGTMYHYRVVATNTGGISRGDDQAFTTYSPSFRLDTTVNFPSRGSASDYKATDYRLVGLPGASDRAVNEFFTGKQNENWEVIWDNGASINFFVRFNGGADFKFSVGRAFWVINKGPLRIDTAAPSALLDSCRFTSIPLRSGWNLITNPFTTPVSWSIIQSANGLTDPIHSYTGIFSTSSSFEPYLGYYFFNTTNLSALKIPYSSSSAASVAMGVDPALWRVRVTMTSGEFVDKLTSFGVANEARSELDPLDFRKPRAIAAAPTVSFHRPTWDAKYSAFATDIRPEIAESESWEFEVRSTTRAAAQLTFAGIDKIPSSYEVYLIDECRVRMINLREDSLYRFTSATEISKFSVVVGKKEAVQEKVSAVALPKEFALGHNYPNPFSANGTFGNPETTIPVAVPMTSETKLVVYNILGLEVKTIYGGTLQAGRYWFNWEGKDATGNPAATGVYFYRLTTSTGVALLGKMLVIR